jgi:hypothetical protein
MTDNETAKERERISMKTFLRTILPILLLLVVLTLPIAAEEHICGDGCVLPIELVGIPCEDDVVGEEYTDGTSLPAPYAAPSNVEYYYRGMLQKLGDRFVYAYDALVNGYTNMKSDITVYNSQYSISTDEMQFVIYCVEYDHPEFFWVGNSYRYIYNTDTNIVKVIQPNYIVSSSEIAQAKAVFEATAQEFLAHVEGMTDKYQMQKTLHDLIVDKGVYASSVHAHDAYGILVDGVGVCESYAKAFQYLLQRSGIQTAVVTGYAGGLHAWCAVNLDGNFYYNDITWADVGVVPFYGYFNVSESLLTRTHTLTPFDSRAVYPVCNSLDAAYFTREGGFLTQLTVTELAKEIKRQGNVTRVYDLTGSQPISSWLSANITAAADASGVPWARCAWRYTTHECIITVIPPANTNLVASGKLGADISWSISQSGLLKIDGRGDMPNFASYTEVPWYSQRMMIKDIIVGGSVTSIGSYAFYGCDIVERVTISDGVRAIGDHAFAGCDRLTSINVPRSLESIGERAFFYCRQISSITLPRNVKSIGEGAFLSCDDLTSVTFETTDGWMISLKKDGGWQDFAVSSPSTNAQNLTETYFEFYWKRIQAGSEGLVYSINIDRSSYSIKSIGSCTDTHIVVPEMYNGLPVTEIGRYAFAESNIQSIELPDSLLKICEYAFENCKSLTALNLPKNVKSIARFAFYGCDSLATLKVDAANTTLQSINNCVISRANKCLVAVCPASVLPADGSVTAIAAYVLASYGKRALEIPASVSEIDEGAFACHTLTVLSVAEGNTVYRSEDNCVIYIAEKQLLGAASPFKIPSDGSVEKIAPLAFFGNVGLESIVIPDSVAEIGKQAFYGCVLLCEISYEGTEEMWAEVVKGSSWDKNTGDYAVKYMKSPTLTITGGQAKSGETVALDFVISDLPLFQALGFSDFEYDASVFEIVSGEWLVDDAVLVDFDMETMVAVMTYDSLRDANGVVFRLTVRIRDGVADGTYSVNCGRVSLDGNDGQVAVVAGEVVVRNTPRGDVTADGEIDVSDAIWCLRHVLFADKFPVVGDVDFNGDGREDASDAVYLLRYVLFGDKFPLS